MTNRKTILAALVMAASGFALTACQKSFYQEPAYGLAADQHKIRVVETAEEFEFAPPAHALDLGPADRAALASVLSGYAADGRGPLVVSYPRGSRNEDAALVAIDEMRAMAYDYGLPPGLIEASAYDARGRERAAVNVSYLRLEAQGPVCGQEWRDQSLTFTNGVSENFGCATKANLAAMISDPADLLAPRTMTSPDAARRSAVLDSYREGEATGSERTEQETGTVSDAVE